MAAAVVLISACTLNPRPEDPGLDENARSGNVFGSGGDTDGFSEGSSRDFGPAFPSELGDPAPDQDAGAPPFAAPDAGPDAMTDGGQDAGAPEGGLSDAAPGDANESD